VQRYDGSCIESKVVNKSALQRRVRLPVTDDVPLLGVLSRFTHQKGLDLLLDVAQKVIKQPAQIVVRQSFAFRLVVASRRGDCQRSR